MPAKSSNKDLHKHELYTLKGLFSPVQSEGFSFASSQNMFFFPAYEKNIALFQIYFPSAMPTSKNTQLPQFQRSVPTFPKLFPDTLSLGYKEHTVNTEK